MKMLSNKNEKDYSIEEEKKLIVKERATTEDLLDRMNEVVPSFYNKFYDYSQNRDMVRIN